MTDKVQKIRGLIERLMYGFNLEADIASCEDTETEKLADIKYKLCKKILEYIDSLQEEPVSEELEEAADNALSNVLNTHEIVNVRSCLEMFRFGAKWQREQDQSTIELAEEHAMLAGMEKMKEQMMTKSIEAVVSQVPCSNEIILYNPSSVDKYYLPQEMNKLGLNKGDKVKLVIIKED